MEHMYSMLKSAAEVIRAEFCKWVSLGGAVDLPLSRQPRSSIVWLALLVDPQPMGPCLVSCGYYMRNCWNVVSYLITISPSNGDDQIFHVATVLFASVVLCRERIGICSPPYSSSSHPMYDDIWNVKRRFSRVTFPASISLYRISRVPRLHSLP